MLAAVARPGTFQDVYEQGTRQFTRSFNRSFAPRSFTRTTTLGGAADGDADPQDGLSVATASFNLANSIVGAGLVGLCFVANSAGIIPFLAFMLFAGYGSTITLDMLAAGADMAGFKDYERIGIAAIGNPGKWATALSVCAQCYGACVAYLVLIESTAPVVGKVIGFELDAVYLQIGISMFVVLPMCILKDLRALAPTAMFALVVYLLVALYVIYSGFTDTWYTDVGEVPLGNGDVAKACPPGGIKWVGDSPMSIVKNFPTIIFAYVCHMTAPYIFLELNGGEVSAMNKVNRLSVSMAGFLYVCVGLFGYVAFTNNSFSSVLQNLRHCVCTEWAGDACQSTCNATVCKDDDILASILNAGFLLAVITGYPVVHFGLRKSLITMFWGTGQPFSWGIHNGIAIANVAGTLVVAISASNVSVVFNWAGSIASPMVAFILPCLFFIALLRLTGKTYETVGVRSGRLLLVIGLLMMVVGVAINVSELLG